MKLIEKELRDLIGIDTFERAIVFSTLLLRQGLRLKELPTNNCIIYQSFAQENNEKVNTLIVEAKIPYESLNFCGLGGDFISSILPFDDDTTVLDYDGDFIPPTVNNQGFIEPDPEDVYMLEQYLIWTISRWIYYHKQQFPENWDSYGYLSFLEEASPPSISAKVILPFDYEKYLETTNLIASVKPKIATSEIPSYSSLIGNSQLFGNGFLVGN